ncbi:MAG TPA: carboxypeptidase-like regulatory domain-containing protein, partial [Kofleriaceae bacterium]|nr:carboxypeptidase-like regulatory domain-containing protein [Kofleriaceae bacterium]
MLCGLAATAAADPPRVEIRAQTRIALDEVRLIGVDQAEVRGQLVDARTGDGIAGQMIAIQVGSETARATTGPDGRFRVTVPVSPGPQPIDLAFRGGALIDGTRLRETTDPSRTQVVLTIDVEDAPGGLQVTVHATADDRPVPLAVALSLGPPDGPLAVLTHIAADTPYLVTRKAAGGPGTRKLRAEFAGDDTRQAATAERTVELTAASTTTIQLSSQRIAYEDSLVVSGKVVERSETGGGAPDGSVGGAGAKAPHGINEEGPPVARAAVTLASGDRRLAQGATGEDGSYRFRVEGEILGQGQWGLQVQADPGKPWIRPSRSPPEVVRVSAPQPVPVSYTIAAFLATACAAGGFFAARSKPWRKLRRPAPPAEMPVHGALDEPLDGGLVVAKPGLVSTLRRASDDGFAGAVRDAVRGRPVADASVRLVLGDVERAATTGADGGFAFEALAMGEWLAEVSAPGHVTETFAVSIPHRGELRGVRVDLVPVRERVFQLYRRAAEPILPEPRLWGVWSPRQIVDHVRAKRPTPALAELTDFVEEVYFSPRLAEQTVLPMASER